MESESSPGMVLRGKVIITDKRKYEELVAILRDIKRYRYIHTLATGYNKEQTIYTLSGAEKHQKVKSDRGTSVYTTSYYVNPNASTLRLITGNMYQDENLLDLFTTTDFLGYKEENCLKEYEQVRRFLSVLMKTSMDNEMIKRILKSTWPSFGYYAIDGLDCTDIEIVDEYSIKDILDDDEIKKLIIEREIAKKNTKVLSLARRFHNLTKY